MKLLSLAACALLFLFGNWSSAMEESPRYARLGSLPIPETFVDNNKIVDRGSYILPNEFNLFPQIDALAHAAGLMASVGTFRTLVIYGWAERITHLLAVDYDAGVIRFNRWHFDFI